MNSLWCRAAVGFLVLQALPVGAADATGTTTSEIFTNTVEAVFQCIRWRPKGICFWLKCSLYECHVEETLRVEHFTPDVTVSTWHDPSTHPWKDYGRTIAQKLDGAGKSLVKLGAGGGGISAVDSAGTKTKDDRDTRNFIYRGADAIGNPVNFVQGAITGNFGSSMNGGPSSIPIPMPFELMQWFSQFPMQVAQQWASVPSSYTSGQTSFAQQQTSSYSSMLGLAGSASNLAGSLANLYSSVIGAYTTADGVLQLTNGAGGGEGSGNGGPGGGTGGAIGSATGGSDVMCPPGIMPFGLAFQSDLDSLFWRGILPFESIYPATWLPGMREVGQGILQTWGNVWPRQGAIFQQNPVKGSAVIAQRTGDIISYHAQPHIYTALQLDTDPNYVFFGFQGIREHDASQTRWQRLFPNPEHSCQIFGTNDSTSLSSYGDGQNIDSRGAIWNAWRRQDCCKKPSGAVIFIGSIGE